jgi:hypothetical protein
VPARPGQCAILEAVFLQLRDLGDKLAIRQG